jgi:hypothetical protein
MTFLAVLQLELFDTVGTLLSTGLAGGADLQVVKERLGQASIATTEKYSHTLPDADDTARMHWHASVAARGRAMYAVVATSAINGDKCDPGMGNCQR